MRHSAPHTEERKTAGAQSGRVIQFLDSVATHPFWGYPLFLAVMYMMFFCTFNLGQYPVDWINTGVVWLSDTIKAMMDEGPLRDLLTDGIISGVGGVLMFVPNILILYAFITWMDESGYLARTAFIMDRIMHRMGLHGTSFLPMVMGFGCNTPAVLATRTIKDRKSRLITMLVIPMMSCSARLPVYMIIIPVFFPRHSTPVLFSIYLIGICLSVIMAKVFSRVVMRGHTSPCGMDLPPYRLPSAMSVARHTWEKGRQYLKKMGTTILLASIAVWALCYFPRNPDGDLGAAGAAAQLEQSYVGQFGKLIEPVIKPCGMNWQEGVAVVAGIGAKEIIASTLSVLSRGNVANLGLSPLSSYSFMVFVLLFLPCVPTLIAIKKETGHWKWPAFAAFYTCAIAWALSTLIYQAGNLVHYMTSTL